LKKTLFSFKSLPKSSLLGGFIAFIGVLILLASLFADTILGKGGHVMGPLQFGVFLFGVSLLIVGIALIKPAVKLIYKVFAFLEKHCFIGLVLLLVLNIFLRLRLEQADKYIYNYYALVLPDLVKNIGTFPWWKIFNPAYVWAGSSYYSPLSAIMMLYLPTRLGAANTWVLLNVLLIITTFFTSWFAFHSRVFSYTLCILLGFGTQLFHIYHMSGNIAVVPAFIFYQINLLLILKIFTDKKRKFLWRTLYVVSFIIMALYNLAWLDYLVFIWVLSVFLLIYFWYTGQQQHFSTLAYVFGAATCVGVLYIFIKMQFSSNQIIAEGAEEDVIFNYPYLILAVEDFISNLVTNFYLAISNFLPPFMVGSNSQFLFGSDQLIALQNGYHPDYAYLIPMQHLFFWRYYAGMWFSAFIYLLIRFSKKAFRSISLNYLALAIFIIMIFVGSPTHLIIKARPYMSVPLLSYRVVVGILGVSLFIAYLVMLAWQIVKNRRLAAFIVVLVWTAVFLGAFTRPPYLDFLTSQVGISYGGVGPDPIRTLFGILFN
jgi:hypothetical protein